MNGEKSIAYTGDAKRIDGFSGSSIQQSNALRSSAPASIDYEDMKLVLVPGSRAAVFVKKKERSNSALTSSAVSSNAVQTDGQTVLDGKVISTSVAIAITSVSPSISKDEGFER